MRFAVSLIGLAIMLAGCSFASKASPAVCVETPAQDRWPEVYGPARGVKDIWLVGHGGVDPERPAKVAWRVVGPAQELKVDAKRLDGAGAFSFTVKGRVAPNGDDQYPTYWDSVSYLTFPAPGCWQLTMQAAGKKERITLDVTP